MSIGAGPIQSNFAYGFANGLTVRGLPVEQTYPGRSFWVYNGTKLAPGGRGGSDGNRGSFESPFATIQGALAQCLAGRGDIIWVKPGHVEPTIIAAGGLNLNVSGVQIVGLGYGANRPQIAFGTAAAASITVTAAGMSLVNFQIDCTGVANLTNAVSVGQPDFAFLGNDVILANATNQAAIGLNIGAFDGTIVSNNRFRGTNNGVTSPITFTGGSNNGQITENLFFGAFGTAAGAINNASTLTDLLIDNNKFVNLTAASTKAIVLAAGTTGLVSNNKVQILSGTVPLTGAAVSSLGNVVVATAGPQTANTIF